MGEASRGKCEIDPRYEFSAPRWYDFCADGRNSPASVASVDAWFAHIHPLHEPVLSQALPRNLLLEDDRPRNRHSGKLRSAEADADLNPLNNSSMQSISRVQLDISTVSDAEADLSAKLAKHNRSLRYSHSVAGNCNDDLDASVASNRSVKSMVFGSPTCDHLALTKSVASNGLGEDNDCGNDADMERLIAEHNRKRRREDTTRKLPEADSGYESEDSVAKMLKEHNRSVKRKQMVQLGSKSRLALKRLDGASSANRGLKKAQCQTEADSKKRTKRKAVASVCPFPSNTSATRPVTIRHNSSKQPSKKQEKRSKLGANTNKSANTRNSITKPAEGKENVLSSLDDDAGLEEIGRLLVQHNAKVCGRKQHYVPRVHSTNDIRLWEHRSGRKWYQLSPTEKELVNLALHSAKEVEMAKRLTAPKLSRLKSTR